MTNKKLDPTLALFRREIIARYHHNKRLYEMPIERAIATGEVVGPAKFIQNNHEIQAIGFQFKLRKGDRVKLCILNNGKLEPVHKIAMQIVSIRFTEVGVSRFVLDLPNFLLESNQELFMVLDYDSMFDWKIFNKIEKSFDSRKKYKIDVREYSSFSSGLNDGQAEAIEKILSGDFSGVIQGPPGTGKTEVLSNLVELAIKNDLRIGVLSFTHKAVDNALNRISQIVKEGVVRVAGGIKADVNENISMANSFAELRDFKVFGATTHSFLLSSKRPMIDIIILDEASQIPSYFLMGLKHVTSNIVMIGDNQQLPPVMRASNYTKCAVDCFTAYKNEDVNFSMLDTQYRMNETIQEWSSHNYYEGKLKAHHSNAKRDIFAKVTTLSFGNSVVSYHGTGSGQDKLAREVIALAKEAKQIGNLNWEDIGIISPHRLHGAHINRLIQEEFGVDVNNQIFADTVDRYQGREKEFIIYTVSESLSDPADFLNDYRRINVAITRAKSRFYVVTDYRERDGEEFSRFLDWCRSISNSKRKDVA